MKKMYTSINKEALNEIFEFIRQGEVFSVLTYDEIITYEIIQENAELKNKIENVKNPHVNYNNFVNNEILNNNFVDNNITPNKKIKSQNKDKYNDINTGIELKEQTKGLTGLNVASNRMVNNIVSKKALEDYNNNLRGTTLDPTKKSNYKIKNDKNFLEENVKKLKEVKKNIENKNITENVVKKEKKRMLRN